MPFDDNNPWSAWLSRHFPGTFAHPDAPAGGSGYGFSRTPGPTTYTRGAPDPHSPVGLNITPREAAQGYAEYEFEQVRSGIRQAMSWAGLREMALRSLGPKSFALGACYGIVKNPAMSVAGLLQLQKMFIEADLYERLTRPMSWKTMLGASWGIGGPSLFELGELAMIKFHLMNVEMLKHSYEAREALIKEVGQIFTHPLDFFAKAKDQLKASYVEKWNQFCLLQKQTDLKSQFEAGEIFGDVLMEVVMLVLTVISVGAGAAKLAAKVPQLVRVAEFVRGARAAEVGGAAEEAAEIGKGATATPASGKPLSTGENPDVFHTVTNPRAGQGVVDGIDPAYLNPNSRFGKAFYISDDAPTTLAELEQHGATGSHTIRFEMDASKARTLDLTDPSVAGDWGYAGGAITPETQAIGASAKNAGYNVIKFQSLRGLGANYAVINDFDSVLTPKMIVPTP